ncbi:TPA: glutaredoxin [Neisseria meningitidis]|uniref:glutaredoxin n=1 Tax=Neisseria TaxID=482 RepID=UPI000E57327F|nr:MULTISPECIES: glutaredoxin [Neisseria]
MPSERSDGIFNTQKKPFIPRVSMNGQYIAGKRLTCCTAEKGETAAVISEKDCTRINVKKR